MISVVRVGLVLRRTAALGHYERRCKDVRFRTWGVLSHVQCGQPTARLVTPNSQSWKLYLFNPDLLDIQYAGDGYRNNLVSHLSIRCRNTQSGPSDICLHFRQLCLRVSFVGPRQRILSFSLSPAPTESNVA